MTYDPERIEDPCLEEADTSAYYVECCAFLDEFLEARSDLADQEIRRRVRQLLEWMCADPVDREAGSAEDVAIDLHLFGLVGKAMYFLRANEGNSQFREEVRRFFSNMDQVRGNAWLFYTAGLLARNGFEIEFIGELGDQGKKTPDYRAHRGDFALFVEANARSQEHSNTSDLANLLWDVMHGDKKSGKQLKFKEPQYDPGVIAVDVSNCDVNANSTGLPPSMRLIPGAVVVQNDRGYVYDLAKDQDFFQKTENTGNLVEYAIRYFHMMAAKGKYHVRALLVGMTFHIFKQDDTVSAPKGAVLIVDRRYPQLAIQELARSIYLVDTQSPLPADPGAE